ncbi:MAG TPA: beta-hexosaminidase, partial [Pseudoxanthomonas sp.]|nr:beta-hexosaminidase [Pseudoxanthomonas sp.]
SPYREPLQLNLPVQVRAAVFADGHALVAPSSLSVDAASRLSRTDEQLAMCTQSLMLRLEDDGPLKGERASFNVDIFNPCWSWKAAPLQGISKLQVRAGQIPYYFQLAHDESHRKFVTAKSAHGELEISAGCEGKTLASVPLPAKPDADGFVSLSADLPAQNEAADLCIRFTGDTRPTMWVLDRVTLVPASTTP